jgi:hypothetical protein
MNGSTSVCDRTRIDAPLNRIDSGNLIDLEQWIVENVRVMSRCRLAICLAFARIKTEELYKQAGIRSFSGYLSARRVKIHYHTAHDYALIGEVYTKYRDRLEAFHFTEYDGLRKLLLLEQGLARANGREEAVYTMLKSSSFREFKRYVQSGCQSGRPDSIHRGRTLLSINVMLSDECLILMPDRRELLWFDPELDEVFESTEMVHRFKRFIVGAVEEFFSPHFSCNQNQKSSTEVGFQQ